MQDLDDYIKHLQARPELKQLLAPLLALIEQQAQLIQQQAQRIEALEAEVAQLRARLDQNSTNSHTPPSADPYRSTTALPKAKGRRTGGQVGHQGHTLTMTHAPDHTEQALPKRCSAFGAALAPETVVSTERRQVFDLPAPRLVVTEYRRPRCRCLDCGTLTQAAFPDHVKAPVQYGRRLGALAALLHSDYHVPLAKVSQLCEDLFGQRLSEATLAAANARVAEAVLASESAIKARLVKSDVAHADETGLRVSGRLQWLHVLSSDKLSHYLVHAKRGRDALESAASVLPQVSGYLIHDCWASYFGMHQGAHGLCNAHLVRELRAQTEQGQWWAEALIDVLLTAREMSLAEGVVPPERYRVLKRRYFALLRQGLAAHPMPKQKAKRVGRKKRGKARSLLRRLIRHHASVWRLACVASVPFTNNQAERDLRMAKVKQKVSGGFRTESGAAVFARIRGYCSTARKQRKPVYESLCRALEKPGYLLVPYPT
ncbi:MAG: IS66 family transposase [Bacteroidota bacterium]